MKLDFAQTYAADPERVVALLRTPEFIEDVAEHAGALSHTVQVSPDATRLGMRLPVPSHLAKFVGESIQIDQVFRFDAPRPDGVIDGTVDVDVPGMPVDVKAAAQLRPQAGTTQAVFNGELKVKIPLVGRKVEAQIEPFIRDAFDGLERRAADWLSR